MTTPRVVTLVEYRDKKIPSSHFDGGHVTLLNERFGTNFSVRYPSPKTNGQWVLKSNGWVGYIPLSSEIHLSIQPQVSLKSIFMMLEYAYGLKSFRVLEDLFDSQTLREFYQRLARILARRVTLRTKKGLHRHYLARSERLTALRGRLDMTRLSARPWQVQKHCEYDEQTKDVEDNQILIWTLHVILRSGLLDDVGKASVSRAYRALRGSVSLKEFRPADCIGRSYNRLNEDYEVLHKLCRLFLEFAGPTHRLGDWGSVPFMVRTNLLFEKFVAEWLRQNIGRQYRVIEHHIHRFPDDEFWFDIDIVLEDRRRNKITVVIDTKYKATARPAVSDIYQAVAYAHTKGARHAILVYPAEMETPLDVQAGTVRVKSAVFGLGGDVDAEGRCFLESISNALELWP